MKQEQDAKLSRVHINTQKDYNDVIAYVVDSYYQITTRLSGARYILSLGLRSNAL